MGFEPKFGLVAYIISVFQILILLWFWTYANIGSNIEAMRDILFDKFVVSSSNPEEDNIFSFLLWLFLGFERSEVSKRVTSGRIRTTCLRCKTALFFFVPTLRNILNLFILVRFSVVHFIYECFNYSSLKWITVQDGFIVFET